MVGRSILGRWCTQVRAFFGPRKCLEKKVDFAPLLSSTTSSSTYTLTQRMLQLLIAFAIIILRSTVSKITALVLAVTIIGRIEIEYALPLITMRGNTTLHLSLVLINLQVLALLANAAGEAEAPATQDSVSVPEATGVIASYQPSTDSSFTDDSQFKARILSDQNWYRKQHDAPDLVWDNKLEKASQVWVSYCIISPYVSSSPLDEPVHHRNSTMKR